ncbi:MAG: metallophosphoesterase [Nanoarchaeota archaeon]|nr:metallophosphoesterase [Nanoarchaeota archaeon]
MGRIGVINDTHGRDLEQALNKFNFEKVDAILFNGDIFEPGHIENGFRNLKKLIKLSDKPSYFLPGSHEDMNDYNALMDNFTEKNPEQIFDLTRKDVTTVNGYTILPIPGTTWFPNNNDAPLLIDVEAYTKFKNNLNNVNPEKTIVMCHIPGLDLGDTAYFVLTQQGLIPGFNLLGQYSEQALKFLKPQNALSNDFNFSSLLIKDLQEKKPLAFISGHIHENNAFKSPGKNILTLEDVAERTNVKNLAFTPGSYTKDPLQQVCEQSEQILKKHGLELNTPWSESFGIINVGIDGVSYNILTLEK